MSRIDPLCFSRAEPSEPVCSRCFADEDIADFILGIDGPRGCAFCGKRDAPTAPLNEVAAHIRTCLLEVYGFADDQLPYESREGGYQGRHWDTYDLLYDELQLDLPRDRDHKLFYALPDLVGQEVWCEWDWLSLDYDEALTYSWQEFCQVIQHKRRFFFALTEDDDNEISSHDSFAPFQLLNEIKDLLERFSLIQTLPVGSEFYRARPHGEGVSFSTARDLGPPPAHLATQANRMNPPGIPMTYAAETFDIAFLETRSARASVGRFQIERPARLLDLAALPPIPGVFSGAERKERLGLIFMHAFAREIAKPVERNDRIHIEYIPSQVVTEFIRDAKIDGDAVDGIRYPSAVAAPGRNLVLFATQEDFMEPDGAPVSDQEWPKPQPWIRLIETKLAHQ